MKEQTIVKEWAELSFGGVAGCGASKPAITATRMKGEDITEMRPVVVGQKPGKVLLELTPEAAEALEGLLGWHVSGPDTGPRGTFDQMWRALKDVGVRGARLNTLSEPIYFL